MSGLVGYHLMGVECEVTGLDINALGCVWVDRHERGQWLTACPSSGSELYICNHVKQALLGKAFLPGLFKVTLETNLFNVMCVKPPLLRKPN